MINSKKKVLYIVHAHPAFSRGGGELAAYYLYQAMKSYSGYKPYLLARISDPSCRFQHPGSRLLNWEKDDATHLLISNGCNYDYFYQTKIDSMLAEADLYSEVGKFLLALNPEIVHFQHYIHMGVDLISYVRSLLPNARIVLTLHEFGAICAHDGSMLKTDGQLCYRASPLECSHCFPLRKPSEFFLRERLIKSNFAAVNRFYAPSMFLKERYVDWGIDPERIIVIDHGRPIWVREKRVPRLSGQPFRAAFFGQMVFHKGWDVFLKAAEEYAQLKSKANGEQIPDVRFSLYGTRQLSDELTGRLNRLIESTRSVLYDHGPYDMQSMQYLLSRLHCIVVPSVWWENSPLVIQEAFMSGLPVICSNIGGMAEKVMDRVNGLHFAVGDHFDLLDRILELAESAELCNRLAQAIPQIKSDRDIAGEISFLYDELLEEPGNLAADRRNRASSVLNCSTVSRSRSNRGNHHGVQRHEK